MEPKTLIERIEQERSGKAVQTHKKVGGKLQKQYRKEEKLGIVQVLLNVAVIESLLIKRIYFCGCEEEA